MKLNLFACTTFNQALPAKDTYIFMYFLPAWFWQVMQILAKNMLLKYI